MKIVHAYPPNFDEVSKAFDMSSQSAIFAYGFKIYNPWRKTIPPELIAHEVVHGQRQGDCPEDWWKRYIDEPQFRLDEEFLAHLAEYAHLAKEGNRGQRRRALKYVAHRLAAPLYGRLIAPSEAKRKLAAEYKKYIQEKSDEDDIKETV